MTFVAVCNSFVLAEMPIRDAARVNGKEITPAEVDAVRRAALREETPPQGDQLRRIVEQTLEQLIDREVVLGALAKSGHRASSKAVDEAVAKTREKFAHDEQLFQRFLHQNHSTEKVLRGQLEWKLSWESYLQATLTDQVLETYFQAHRADFDGTEVRVSQILLSNYRGTASGSEIDGLKTKAEQIRADIAGGKLTFADAAKQHSTGATREMGGDLGFIPRHDVMDEKFSQAAFALKKGEVSPPVVSKFGVHLIQVTDVRLGTKTWGDVRREVRDAAAAELYQKILATERPRAKIEYGPFSITPRSATK